MTTFAPDVRHQPTRRPSNSHLFFLAGGKTVVPVNTAGIAAKLMPVYC